MRILHLADHMGYGGRVPHGMTTYLLLVLPRVRAAGHEVAAAFLREPHRSAMELEQQGVRTHFMDSARWNPLLLLSVARLIRKFNPDVVHATQVQAVLIARALKALGFRFRLVVHMHNLDRIPGALRWINRKLPQPEVALCVSRPTMKTAEREYGIDAARLRVFPNAFDAAAFLSSGAGPQLDLRAELDLPASALVVGRVARFHVDKGNDRLVRAMRRIIEAVPQAVAVFAGDGPERQRCEAMGRQLGIADRLRFLGHRADIARIVAGCDVMTITSPAEPFGYVALEAFALGKPVIGFRAGGLPEVVTHEVDGLLAMADDETEFANLVVTALSQPALRARLATAARLAIERFSISEHVAALLAVYTRAGA